MDQGPVKIYVAEDVPRLRYIVSIILGEILGLNWEVVTDKRKLGKHFVINYSDENIKGSFKIIPASLLFEKGVMPREISIGKWEDLPVFFQTVSGSDLPFDIFAASFYLVSRYEEYYDYESDEYGRYRASSSLAFRNGFLGIPVVDLWAKEFAKVLLRRFQTLAFKGNEYRALVTFDTDQPFEYLGKGILRSLGGFIRDLTLSDGHAADRFRIVAKGEKDPFEVFDYIKECIDGIVSDAMFFFPVGDRSEFDHNPSWKNQEYCSLIQSLSDIYRFGLHPSYYASDNLSLLEKEAMRLKSILETDITSSRYHYIKFKLPYSYRNLVKAGITEDYSMGYPDEPGFRAGIARPFSFYDVEEDFHSSLKIIPFQVMDATLYKYKKLDCEASEDLMKTLISETRKAGGLFVSIWHNTSLQDNHEWSGWRNVFESMLEAQKP